MGNTGSSIDRIDAIGNDNIDHKKIDKELKESQTDHAVARVHETDHCIVSKSALWRKSAHLYNLTNNRNFTDPINSQNTIYYFSKCTHMYIYLLSTNSRLQ